MKRKYYFLGMALMLFSNSLQGQWYNNTTTVENPLMIKKTTLPISIDGNPNDVAWTALEWIPLTKSNNRSTNFSAYFKISYDDANVYVLVKVYDDTPFYTYNSEWQSDNVAIYFSMDLIYTGEDIYSEGMWHIRYLSGQSSSLQKVTGRTGNNGDTWQVGTILQNSNFKVAQMDYYPYFVEWQVPWNLLIGNSNFDHQNFKFEIEVDNCNSYYEREQLFWNSNYDDQWTSNRNMGYVRLSDVTLNPEICKQYVDSLKLSRDSISLLTNQLNQLNIEKTNLTNSLNQLQLTLNQTERERNTIADSLATLYNLLVKNQYIKILAFNEVTTTVAMKQGTVNLHLYPNPARNRMVIECSENITSYSIYTTSGTLITTSAISPANPDRYEIELPLLAPGLYNLHLQTNKGTIAVLFLRQ